MPIDLPRYKELPLAPHGGRSAWQVFGEGDSLGRIGLQGEAATRAAARLVESGAVFALNASHTLLSPPLFNRGVVRHTLFGREAATYYDDVYDNYYPQASSQWDSLAHAAYTTNVYYQGATADEIADEHRNTIEHWARRGIVGRGVLLDVQRTLAGVSGYHPAASYPLTIDDLETTRRRAHIEFQVGDVVLIHTGFLDWYRQQPPAVRAAMRSADRLTAAGIDHSEAMAEYVWNSGAAAFATDAPALEVWPPDHDSTAAPFGYLHRMLIGQFGLAVGELWWLHDLAVACHDDGRYAFLLTSAPVNMPGGAGSPANALAIK